MRVESSQLKYNLMEYAISPVCVVTVVEVERLWLRFQQLGCNEQGLLTLDAITRPPISNDIFIKLACTYLLDI